jgi:hypothetical protein
MLTGVTVSVSHGSLTMLQLVQRLGHNEKSQTPGIAIRGALTYSPSQFPGVTPSAPAPCRDALIQLLYHKLQPRPPPRSLNLDKAGHSPISI